MYDASRPRRGEQGPDDDPFARHFRPREPYEAYRQPPADDYRSGGYGLSREADFDRPGGHRRGPDDYRDPRTHRSRPEYQAPPPERPRAPRGLLEVAGAVVLVVLSAAVTWAVAGHHYKAASAAAGPGAGSPSAPEPETAAGALAAASSYFALYGAGQYAAVYPLIAPAARALIPESVWTGLHQQCGQKSGLSYKVAHPVLSGPTAVMSVGFTGAASAIGSEQVTFTYSGGRWYYEVPDLQVYQGHNLAQAVAAAKAANLC